MRYAIYYTPPPDDPLTRAAELWLGRSAFTGEAIPAVAVAGLSAGEVAYQTAAPRRYGFHATLKAPFRLAEGVSEDMLISALDAYCARMTALAGPRLILSRIEGFFALVPESPDAALDALANDVVATFEPFRAPMTDAEFARRNPDALSPAQIKNLHLWGYPYVFDTFRFHMTLTGRVSSLEAPRVEAGIIAHFGDLVPQQRVIGSLALLVEQGNDGPFIVRSFHSFAAQPATATPARKFA